MTGGGSFHFPELFVMQWASLKASELQALSAKNSIVVIPVASIENHGPHLATGVDIFITEAIANRAAERCADVVPVVVTPAVWCALGAMHFSLGGTMTLNLETLTALLRCLVRSAVQQGFRRVLLLNGHGGNVGALMAITNDLGAEFNIAIATATYSQLAKDEFAAILEDQTSLEHACEGETSMMLALRPELVDRSLFSRAIGPTSRTSQEVAGPAVHRWRSFAARTSHGAIGNPTRSNAGKGEKLLDAAADRVADLLRNEEFWTMTF
jgi:creatinine amidohydrolase